MQVFSVQHVEKSYTILRRNVVWNDVVGSRTRVCGGVLYFGASSFGFPMPQGDAGEGHSLCDPSSRCESEGSTSKVWYVPGKHTNQIP
jgi:hypothetical protein